MKVSVRGRGGEGGCEGLGVCEGRGREGEGEGVGEAKMGK